MTTKTLGSLILAGVLATSAAAAVQVIEPASVPATAPSASSLRAEAAASNEALFVLRFSATPGEKQRPAGIVRIAR